LIDSEENQLKMGPGIPSISHALFCIQSMILKSLKKYWLKYWRK